MLPSLGPDGLSRHGRKKYFRARVENAVAKARILRFLRYRSGAIGRRHQAAGLNFTKLSNRCEQLSHSQKLRTSSPLRDTENSCDSGAIMSSPHLGQEGLPKYRSWK
jgi:hypothetical protein